MKFNLKNRPKIDFFCLEMLSGDKKIQMTKDEWLSVQDWFEGFEKELREAQRDPYALTGDPLLTNKPNKGVLKYREGWRQATFRILRMVLGE